MQVKTPNRLSAYRQMGDIFRIPLSGHKNLADETIKELATMLDESE